MNPVPNERERAVLRLLANDPELSVKDIAAAMGVSQVSVRNYLNSLEEKGYLTRVHGGAVPTYHPSIMEHERTNTDAKKRIARAAADLVKDGDTIMVEAGTTTALIVRFLLGKRDVTIVTNNTLALAYGRGNPGVRMTMTGGEFRPATESLVGPLTREDLERFHVDIAFVGTDGFAPDTGLTTHLVDGAEVVKAMARQAKKTIVVADSSKYGQAGFVQVLPLSDTDTIISDSDLAPEAKERLRECGVEIVLV